MDEEGPLVPEGCVEPPESPVDVTPLPIKHVVLTTTGCVVPTLQEGCWAREQLPSGRQWHHNGRADYQDCNDHCPPCTPHSLHCFAHKS